MRIGIELTGKAYLPEAYAYRDYLSKQSFNVELAPLSELGSNNDLIIQFMGFNVFKNKSDTKIIHEYHSLSTPPKAVIKDYLKRFLNTKPHGRIFLNETVSQHMSFNDSLPFIYRDMGVDDCFIHSPSNEKKEYDIVYAGSIGRAGLIEKVIDLAKLGYKLILVGDVPKTDLSVLNRHKVTHTGRLEKEEISKVYSLSRAGLNFTPDVYPYNIQTSTKTIEYLCAGLSLISNKYPWIEYFANKYGLEPLWLDNFSENIELEYGEYNFNSEFFRWKNILDRARFLDFVKNTAGK